MWREYTCPEWAWQRCRINPPRFLAECRKKWLNQASFVLLYFALFAFYGLCLVFVMSVCFWFALCRVFFSVHQREFHSMASLCWCAVKNPLTHSLILKYTKMPLRDFISTAEWYTPLHTSIAPGVWRHQFWHVAHWLRMLCTDYTWR